MPDRQEEQMHHYLRWRPWLVLAAALAFAALPALDVTPASASHDIELAVDLRDERLRCDGDSARITVTATRNGEPVHGVPIRVVVVSGSIPYVFGPTNRSGRANGWITPKSGTSAAFVFAMGTESTGPTLRIGRCPLGPREDTVSFSALFVDENGHRIAGERVGVATFGYSPSLAIPPHWVRSGHDGSSEWDGIPQRLWDDIDTTRQSRFVCLGEHSRFDIVAINGSLVTGSEAPGVIADHTGSCVSPPQGILEPAVFTLRRK